MMIIKIAKTMNNMIEEDPDSDLKEDIPIAAPSLPTLNPNHVSVVFAATGTGTGRGRRGPKSNE